MPGAWPSALGPINSPFNQCCSHNSIAVQGYTPAPGERMRARLDRVSPGYFPTIGSTLLLGRDFTPGDTATSSRVAVVSEAFVQKYLRGQNPLGHRFGLGPGHAGEIEIVGVVADAKYQDPREAIEPMVFFPLLQVPGGAAASADDQRSSFVDTIVVRAEGDPAAVFAPVRRALALCCLGLYGLMDHAVTRRTRELGVRVALGARPAAVRGMVTREALRRGILGVALGVPLAFATERWVGSQLFEVGGFALAVPAVAALVLLAVLLLAGYLPARRASRVDPWIALRTP